MPAAVLAEVQGLQSRLPRVHSGGITCGLLNIQVSQVCYKTLLATIVRPYLVILSVEGNPATLGNENKNLSKL